MVKDHPKRVWVDKANGKVLGILSRLDILSTIAAVHLPEWHPEGHTFGVQAMVGDVMTRDVPSVHESATLEEIFELLVSSSHKRVVVVDDQRHVAGIIADSDLIRKVSRESWPGVMEVLVSKVPIERIGGTARKHIQRIRARSAKELHDSGCDHRSRGDARRECLGAFGGKARKTITGGKRRRPAGWNCWADRDDEGASHSTSSEEWRVTCGIFLVAFGWRYSISAALPRCDQEHHFNVSPQWNTPGF